MIGFDDYRKQVGRFVIAGGFISGPKKYMTERGNALVDRIHDGDDIVFNANMMFAPIDPLTGNLDVETVLLQRVAADYMAWKGVVIL